MRPLLIIVMILAISLLSCGAPKIRPKSRNFTEENAFRRLPPSAANFKYLGKSWCYFDLDGRRFLFRACSAHGVLAYIDTSVPK